MDIQITVKEILNTGLTQSEIASLVNCSQATISDIAAGKQTTTNLQIGLNLLELHQRLVKNKDHRTGIDRRANRRSPEVKK
jgi:transcriptional regulator